MFDAISKFGESAAQAIDETKKLRKEGALNDTIVEHALNAKQISQEDFNNYQQAPWGKKTAVAHGLMANMHDDLLRDQARQEQANFTAKMAQQMQLAKMSGAQEQQNFTARQAQQMEIAKMVDRRAAGGDGPDNTPTWDPGTGGFAEANAAGGTLVRDGRGGWRFQPYAGGSGSSSGDPSKWRQITIPGSTNTVIVDENNNRVPNSQLQGVLHPNAGAQQLAAALGGNVPAAQPTATSAAAAPAGVSGYIPGRTYAGKKYKGGNPNDPNNWQ